MPKGARTPTAGQPPKGSRDGHAGTPALEDLAEAGVQHTVRSFEHDAAVRNFGAEAVKNLGVEARRVLKTIVLAIAADGGAPGLAVAVVPVETQVNLKAAAAALGVKKAALADPEVAARRTGYVPGGISPLGQKLPLPTLIDSSARAEESVFVSAGRRGLDVELGAEDLARLTSAKFVDDLGR